MLSAVVASPGASGAEAAPRSATVSPVLELYALEAELADARSRVAELDTERTRLSDDCASAHRRLAAARRAVQASQRQLGRVLQALYANGETDALALFLGARSLDEALTGIDALERSARQSQAIGEQARATRNSVQRLMRTLAAREQALEATETAARSHRDALESTVARRRAYVAELARRESAARAAAAEREARAAQQRSAGLSATAEPAVMQEPETLQAMRGVQTLTVDAVAYSLPGHTASGLPVGPGVVAVDPAVIPLGTRMYVPGYGAAIAADVGTAVTGPVIDLWFPTLAEAQAWGRRTVTLTLR
jgi:3D (Asp-Asp-Asp) domain-containing protein